MLVVLLSLAAVDTSAVEHVRPALPEIPARAFSLADYGAVGDGVTLNTEAFRRAIAAVQAAGGGVLTVPKGTYRTLPFALCSHLNLHLDAGATIEAPARLADYGLPDPARLTPGAASALPPTPPLISGEHLHDVALTGEGVIDGNGGIFWSWSERQARGRPGRAILYRPFLVLIADCQRLLVSDLTFSNSPKFHLVPRGVTDLTVRRVKIRAPFNAPNTDGIDPGPVTNAWISECDTDTGDDDICIKSGGHQVLIENCTIRHGHGISIGSGTTDGVSDMLVRHCTFTGSDNGIRIKSMRGAGGPVGNIRYTDIVMRNVANALILDLNYTDSNRPDFIGERDRIPSIDGILIDHVTAAGGRNAGRMVGLPERPIRHVTLSEVRIAAEKPLVIRDAEPPQMIHSSVVASAP